MPAGDTAQLSFEYHVPAQAGKGKASLTDLMISTGDDAIAIEAKYTEPHYESVSTWLSAERMRDETADVTGTSNRERVLHGWLSAINECVGGTLLTQANVGDCTYQLIHRTASVCAISAETSRSLPLL